MDAEVGCDIEEMRGDRAGPARPYSDVGQTKKCRHACLEDTRKYAGQTQRLQAQSSHCFMHQKRSV